MLSIEVKLHFVWIFCRPVPNPFRASLYICTTIIHKCGGRDDFKDTGGHGPLWAFRICLCGCSRGPAFEHFPPTQWQEQAQLGFRDEIDRCLSTSGSLLASQGRGQLSTSGRKGGKSGTAAGISRTCSCKGTQNDDPGRDKGPKGRCHRPCEDRGPLWGWNLSIL